MKDPQGQDGQAGLTSINTRTGRNMPQAIATGAALVILIVLCLLARPDAFMFLIVVFMTLGLWELRVDFATAGLYIPVVALWLGSAGTMLAMFYCKDHLGAMTAGVLLTAVIASLASGFQGQGGQRLERAVLGKTRLLQDGQRAGQSQRHAYNGYANMTVTLLTVLYITLLACMIVLPTTFGEHPVAHGAMTVFLPAVSDIGGLFFGAFLGRHKLSPRISPKKSVEGLAGSMLSCVVAAGVIFVCTYPVRDLGRTWWVAILLGAMVGVTGTFGDLSASLIKRDLGIKDMGHFLKGHGGVLDRVDSILMSAPFITLLLWFTGL
ncbi:phosphatidate cytidylyltransferase [Bifidobacterium xylocopae]|uniref:Phosphatidate cytidylyltransferase n=1 Tax=Bifidobacterium xylocopae TaxID=2493119 RepID=A0A366KC46_9BIFI|nr:phosphatidate cytidylyltransferase [Bifidobacterium xylocopae]RBP99264.1 phosphatidate cytidylyltransferase [Bifidobacterium xylocopae]